LSDPPPILPPRFQYKAWVLLAIPAAFAALFALISALVPRYNPFLPHPYWAALANETRWCSSPAESFMVPYSAKSRQASCILKVAYIDRMDPEFRGLAYDRKWSVNAAGEHLHRAVLPWSARGGQSTFPAGTIPRINQALTSMPPSTLSIPRGRTVLVGFYEKGAWVIRTYDRAALPASVEKLFAVSEIKLP